MNDKSAISKLMTIFSIHSNLHKAKERRKLWDHFIIIDYWLSFFNTLAIYAISMKRVKRKINI